MTTTNRARAKKPRTWERWAGIDRMGWLYIPYTPNSEHTVEPRVGEQRIRVRITELKPRGRRR